MVAPLIALAAALISKKMQDQEQKSAYEEELRREAAAAQARIADRRAQRAGDSGYMQQAAGSMLSYSKPQPSQSGPMLAQIGGALMSQRSAPEQSSNKTIEGPEGNSSLKLPSSAELTANRYDYEPDKYNYYV